MGNTGRYIWDEETQKVIKISDEIPSISTFDVWFPKGGTKYFDKALRQTFYSKQEKRDYLKQHKLRQFSEDVSKDTRDKQYAENINMERKKQGLKPKTLTELKGNG